MVEANLNEAHHIMTYLSILFLPIILSLLLTKLVETSHDLSCCREWNHVRLTVRYYPRKHRKKKKARQPSKIKGQAQRKKPLMLTYLLLLALISFKAGCRVEPFLHRLQAALNEQYFPKWNILKYFFNSCAGIYKIFQTEFIVTSASLKLLPLPHPPP